MAPLPERGRSRGARRLAALAPWLLWVSIGCVGAEQREAQAARRAYDACVAEHGERDATCQVLRERSLEAQRRYERRARQQWGCDPMQPDCPPTR